MNKDKLEGRFTMAHTNGVPLDVIQEYRAISVDDAIRRFLPKSVRNKIVDNGEYFFDAQTRSEKLTCCTFCLGMGNYEEEFCRTEQGRLWYESHVVDLAMVAAEGRANIQRYAEELRLGQLATARKLRGIRFVG